MKEEKKEQGNASNMVISIFKFSIPTWANFIIGFASSYILTRVFLPGEYAIISLFTTSTNLLMYAVCLGMDGAYIRFYHEPPNGEDRRLMLTKMLGLFILVLLTVTFIVGTFFGKDFANAMFGIPNGFLSILLSINIFSTVMMRFFNITFRMGMNAKKYGIQNVLMTSVIRLGALLAIPISATAETAIFFQTGSLFLLVLIYFHHQKADILPRKEFFREKKNLRHLFSYKGYGELARFSLFSAPTYIVANANLFFAEQLIRTMLSASAMGVFVAVGYFSKLLEVMRGGFSTYWSAYMYANYETEQKQIIQIHDYVMFVCAGMFFCLIIFKDIIYLLIGAEFRGSKSFFSLLLLGDILRLCSETTVYGINIKKRSDISLMINVTMCLINLCLCWFLIPFCGLKGAAIASAAANLFYFMTASFIGQLCYKSIDSIFRTGICVLSMIFMAIVPAVIVSVFWQTLVLLWIIAFLSIIYKNQIKRAGIFLKYQSSILFSRKESGK